MLKYEIVLVPFPFDNLQSDKVRPAICLTEPIGTYKHVVLAFITSRVLQEQLATDIVIEESDSEFSLTGLRVSSMIRLHRLMTVSTSVIRRKLGLLPENLRSEVDKCLRELFNL